VKHVDQIQLKQLELAKPETKEPIDPDMRQAELADKLASVDLKEAQALKARSDASIAGQTADVQNGKTAAERDKAVAEAQAAMVPVIEHNQVAEQLQEVASAVASIGLNHQALGGQVQDMMKGLGALAGVVMQPKRK